MRILFSKVAIADSQFSPKQVETKLPTGLEGVKVAATDETETFDLLIEQGTVRMIAAGGSLALDMGHPHNAEVKICEGGTVSPGWVDMRVRLTDPGFEWKDDLRSLSKAGVAGGFTRLVCLPNTLPVIDNRDYVESLEGRSQHLPLHVHAFGAVTQGAKGADLAEAFDMHRSGALGFTDGIHPLQDAGVLLRALQYLHSFDGLLVNYPIELRISHGGKVNEGVVSTRLGMPGSPALAEEVNIYSYRQPELIQPLLDAFTESTGIETNVAFVDKGLVDRLVAEGRRSPADIILTVDISRLTAAKDAGVTRGGPNRINSRTRRRKHRLNSHAESIL